MVRGRPGVPGTIAVVLVAMVAAGAACARSVPAPALLLLITVDTLRADRLGAYGSALDLTPALDALAERAVVFARAYAPTSFTVPSVAALMTGQYPEALGIWNNESGLPDDVPTLASELRGRGWHTAAVVSNYVLRRASGVDRGFEHYDDHYPQREAARHWPERVADATTRDALPALDRCTAGEAPCFLWVHYQDPHGPYTPPEALRARYLARERARRDGGRRLPVRRDNRGMGGLPGYQLIANEREVAFYRSGYDAEVRYLDEHVGALLDAVAARGLDRHAVIVFAADHGEGLGEHDYWFAHGEYLSDPLVRVPLLLVAPGVPAGRRDDATSLVDLLPTLLRLLGAVPPDAANGRDLLADGAPARSSMPYLANLGAATVVRHGIVDGRYKYVVGDAPNERAGRLYDVDDESTDIGADLPDLRVRLAERLASVRAQMAQGPPPRKRTLSEMEAARLRALGYLEGKEGTQ